MKELFLMLGCYIAGIGVGTYVVADTNRLTEILGTTYPELSRMKEECEHSLPRNQPCFVSIIFIPTAEVSHENQ